MQLSSKIAANPSNQRQMPQMPQVSFSSFFSSQTQYYWDLCGIQEVRPTSGSWRLRSFFASAQSSRVTCGGSDEKQSSGLIGSLADRGFKGTGHMLQKNKRPISDEFLMSFGSTCISSIIPWSLQMANLSFLMLSSLSLIKPL